MSQISRKSEIKSSPALRDFRLNQKKNEPKISNIKTEFRQNSSGT